MGKPNVWIYKIIPVFEARENPDGTFTAVDCYENQITAKTMTINNREYLIFEKFNH